MRSVPTAAAMSSLPLTALTGGAGAPAVAAPFASNACIDIELIERREQIPLTAREWNDLVAQNETNSIFQTYEWFDAWWQTFGAAHELFFMLLRREGRVIGFAAMMLRNVSWRGRRLEFVGTGNADYQDFVLPYDKPAAIVSICKFLRTRASRWRSAWLSNVPRQSSTLAQLQNAGIGHGLYFVQEAHQRCPALRLESDRSGAEKLLKKYSLKRPLNWFSSRGEVRFRNVSALSEIQSLLPVFFEQHARRWHAVGRSSLFEMGSQRTFYLALAAALHSAGWLLFSVVEFNGQPIAFHFGFDYFGSIMWYKPSFEVKYAEHSPGLLLTRKIIEDGLQRSRHELDFTIGEEAFKDRFANVSRYNVTLSVYHSLPNAMRATGWRWVRRNLGRLRRKLNGSRPSLYAHKEAAPAAETSKTTDSSP
ncbi:GNAT family N-acetyltransferase [Steroidobacter cummioxidans]|uniref:GNAT family N-acetyltransferase n=1 Tax=Steroidobacter cummioxidans TaxID=1803913 RepID=UPI00137A3B88|nr:GNAT family N-acetyltransferase [Steroidobacter cummioxidans]